MASQKELVEKLFEAALDLDPAEREVFLARECGADSALKREVEELLADHARAGSFLEHPPVFLDKAALCNQLLANSTVPADGNGVAPAAEPPGRFKSGQILTDRFVIVRFIAKGGMGEVYEAEDRFLQGVHVALKTILPHIANDPTLRQRFEREVLLARKVNHPNLCPIYEIFHCDEPTPAFMFLTMKLLPGEPLGQRLSRATSISADERLAIVKQMAAGLAAIHDAGIIHRDIKPNNIIFAGNGPDVHLWITDFGLARDLEVETTLQARGAIAGTAGYIAPELMSGHPPSQASDLFAFGVVLHEVFTGEKPKVATNGSSVVASSRLNGAGVPSFCTHLVRECLDLDPKRRCIAFDQALVSLGVKRRERKAWTRRKFIGTAAAGICSLGGITWWEWDKIEDYVHPLPEKRFVALLNWPKTSDSQVAPMLTGALGAIKSELARIEALDHNLFVITPEEAGENVSEDSHLKDVCDPLGANLVLAASGIPAAKHFELVLRLLNPWGQPLRYKSLSCPRSEITSLPDRAVQAAAALLNLNRYLHTGPQADQGTQSIPAYMAFQSAETLMKQPNDTGLEAAIEKYKEAVDLDPHYAIAHAEMALAFGRLYALHRDTAALDLARGNCDVALTLNPNLIHGHLARASVLEQTGDEKGALDEIAKALAIDPSDSRTLVWQAQIYTRLNRWNDAEKTLDRVLREHPNYWLAYNELGVLLNREGNYQDAIKAFKKACLAAPRNAMAFNSLGAVYLQIGDFPEAVGYLKKSWELKPSPAVAYNNSLALRSAGKPAEALPFALKAVEMDSTDDTNWLELGDCYSSLPGHQKDARAAYLRAKKEAERNLQTNASDGPTWMLLGLYQIKSGDLQNALSLISKAESLGASDIDSQLTKAQILEMLGRRDDALNILAACFRRGATRFQIEPVLDFQSLRRDPRYQQMLRSNSAVKDAN